MPASSSIVVTRATKPSVTWCRARAGARRRSARPAAPGRRAAPAGSAGAPRQGRGDDVAGREVAVRRGQLGLAARRTARRRRTPPRRPGPRRDGGRSCVRPARPARRARQPWWWVTLSGAARRRGPRGGRLRTSSSSRSWSRVRPGLFLYFSVGPAGTAPPSPGAGRPRSPGAGPSSPGRGPGRARRPAGRRGVSLNSGLPVLDRWAPASKRAKSRLSAASQGRLPVALPTTSGASMATTQSPST